MTKRTWRWVTRDELFPNIVNLWGGEREPFQTKHDGWTNGGDYALFCADDFAGMTGLTIPTDRPVRVEFSARVVGDEEVE